VIKGRSICGSKQQQQAHGAASLQDYEDAGVSHKHQVTAKNLCRTIRIKVSSSTTLVTKKKVVDDDSFILIVLQNILP
jgi:hypothetical protein